ncbi:hypothetical protein ACVXZ4_12730 [Lacisediminihabitans sp. FW035]
MTTSRSAMAVRAVAEDGVRMAPNMASAGTSVPAGSGAEGAGITGGRFAGAVGAPADAGDSAGAVAVAISAPASAATGAASGVTGGRTDRERGIVDRGFVGRGLVVLTGVVAGIAETESDDGPVDASVDCSDAAVPLGESTTSLDGRAGAFGGAARVVFGRGPVARGFVVRAVVVRGVAGWVVDDLAEAGFGAAGFAVAGCAVAGFAAAGFAARDPVAARFAAPTRDAAEVRGDAGLRARGAAGAAVSAGGSGASESPPEGGAADAPAGFSSGSESTRQPYQCRQWCLCANWASHHELGT